MKSASEDAWLTAICSSVANEVEAATLKFKPFNNPHEGYAVILEELDELWERVRKNEGYTPEAQTEAIQIAAMAIRYVFDLAMKSQ